jgi:hypothetical protein
MSRDVQAVAAFGVLFKYYFVRDCASAISQSRNALVVGRLPDAARSG